MKQKIIGIDYKNLEKFNILLGDMKMAIASVFAAMDYHNYIDKKIVYIHAAI